jgi:hypothetical protein
MYKLQKKPDKEFKTQTGIMRPVATLKDEYGGISHVAIDDHCYVLFNGSEDRSFASVKHWYREAVGALRKLPLPK